MTRFLAELSLRYPHDLNLTPSNSYEKHYNIYELNIAEPPETSYWIDWGGTYNEYIGTLIELYFETFLKRTNSIEELFTTNLSLYITPDRICLVNIPKHPWLYPDHKTEGESVIGFLTSCLNPKSPSLNIVDGINANVRLAIPNFTVKLSENISGVILNQDFSLSFNNNDGYFDDETKWNLFNTPLYLKKSVIENPGSADFKTIRKGLIEDSQTTFDKFQISIADNFRAMGEPVCGVIQAGNFAGISIDENNLGKNIPMVYGRKRVTLLKLNNTNFVAAEFITTIYAVYDKEGNSITYSYNNNTNVITSDKEADSADILGYTENDIGSIISDLITRKTSIPYSAVNWNIEEIDAYKAIAPKVNITFNSGTVKGAIQTVLKSDMAYFIQQNDGRFTVRKYGQIYGIRYVPKWSITKKPDKTWGNAQNNFFSSCVVNYNYINNDEYSSCFYDGREKEAEDIYRRKVTKTFDTELTTLSDANALAQLLSDRYTSMRQTIKIAVGVDTSGFELMDTVLLAMTINGRVFSGVSQYIIKEINPAQDILTLEEISSIYDISGEYPETENYLIDFDNMYVLSHDEQFDFELEGGGV